MIKNIYQRFRDISKWTYILFIVKYFILVPISVLLIIMLGPFIIMYLSVILGYMILIIGNLFIV